jgi:hypothetical protein
MKKTKKNAEDSASITKLLDKIVKEQQKIDRHEGDIVASHIRLGHHLAELRALAKKTWAKQLKSIVISPRVASRYLKIAQHWPDQIGLNESDLLPRLPTDLLKLEWLCRVPRAQLPDLLTKLDCKKATRSQVIAAVREALGEAPPNEGEPDVEEFIERLIQKVMDVVARLEDKFHVREQQDRARELLVAGLRQVQDALTASCASPVGT